MFVGGVGSTSSKGGFFYLFNVGTSVGNGVKCFASVFVPTLRVQERN